MLLDDDASQGSDSCIAGSLPLFGDESYQDAPAAGFDNSRADGVAQFSAGMKLFSNDVSKEPLNDCSKIYAAWSDAASKGERPLDFGFLMQNKHHELADDSIDNEDMSDVILASKKACASSKKRGRTGAQQTEGLVVSDATIDCIVDPTAVARNETIPVAPRPPRRPQEVVYGKVEGENRGRNPMDPPIVRTDVFAWMKQLSDPDDEVLGLLRSENQHTDAAQRHLAPLRSTLYSEMLSHHKEDEMSLVTPYPKGIGYFTRTFKGMPYQAHYRCRAQVGGGWGDEELVLDENVLNRGVAGSTNEYLSVSGPEPNPDHSLYAYGTDFNGSDSYTIRVIPHGHCGSQDNAEGQISLPNTDGSCTWELSGKNFFYVELDTDFRAFKLKMHTLGNDPTGIADPTIMEENDKLFSMYVDQTHSKRFMTVKLASSETSEVHLLDLANPSAGLRCVAPRVFGHQYSIEHCGEWLYLLTNKDDARNCKLCRVSLSSLPNVPLHEWEDLWVPKCGVKFEGLHCFQDFIVIQGRENGQCCIFLQMYGDGCSADLRHTMEFPDALGHSGSVLTPRGAAAAKTCYSASFGDNCIFEADVVRYSYCSFTLPESIYEYHVSSRTHRLLRRQEVPNFDPTLYRAECITSKHRGVPISLVYRKDIHPLGLAGGPFPVLLTGYGAYGNSSDPDFDTDRLSLLDRGMVYALAHVRGGGEFGRDWHEDGLYLKVKNRFADFVDVAETLVALKITTPQQMAAWGTSSGGLLVAASANMRPDLFSALLLEVPFLDVLNTMSDPAVPLTVGEWEEIGNPNERDYFFYMLEYSPYENIRMCSYPAVLATSSLNDSMVGYWEPLKYVSKLRIMRADSRQTLLRANFHEGHGGASDRYECMQNAAFNFAFLLDQLGLSTKSPLVSAAC